MAPQNEREDRMATPRRTKAPKAPPGPRRDDRTALDPASLAEAILDHVEFTQGRPPRLATPIDWYMATAHAVRDRLLQRWIATIDTLRRREVKVVSYLSAEFLMGPHLGNNLVNLGIREPAREAVERLDIGLTLDDLMDREEEPGLGNGGLGRLAACFLESLATLEIPAIGYGIRYEFGIFDQEIRDGWQAEITDKWLRFGNPWEIGRPELAQYVGFGGHTEWTTDADGRRRARWVPGQMVKGVPYDTPVVGYRVNTANLLRLWRAEACESFDFQAFNKGDYLGAVDEKLVSENITKVLYPNDEPVQGKELRLQQQYFFVSCSLQNMLALVEQSRRAARALPRCIRRPAQRHPPLDRRRRADAPARRRPRHGVGPGLGDHAAQRQLHQPHAASRGARALAAAAVPERAPAPPRDHLRDQPALHRRGTQRVSPATSDASPACP